MWSELLEELADAGFRAIAFELPGMGEVLPTPAPWADVLASMDALGVERAALVGNSFGGMLALRVAAVAPERVSALVLAAARAPGVEPSAELLAAWEAEEGAFEAGDIDGAVAAGGGAWVREPAIRERVAAMQRRTYELQGDVPEADEAPDPLTDLAALDMPALVIAAARDFPDCTESAERLAQALPNARLEVVDSGHLVPLEAPERFRELLLGF